MKENITTLIYSRIKLHYNLTTDAELATFLGITAQGISNSIARNSPNWNNIITKCENIDLNWLKTGKGEMLRSNVPAKANEGIPLIPISAMANYGTGDAQVLEYEYERFVLPVFKEAEFLISVKGTSMCPKYNSGDIVACKKLPLDTFFQWNKVYVLDTEQGALVKRIKKGETDDTLTIVSDNPSYEPFLLHKTKIYAIAIVLGAIRQEA